MGESYWEQRYLTADMPWEKGEGSPGLADFLTSHPDFPAAPVVVPGCGTGHDARLWAAAGIEVVGLDIAPSAIRLAQEKTVAAGLQATFQKADFLRDTPPRLFGCVFEHTLYCAIDPSERDGYAKAVARWLRPLGHFLAVHYLIPDVDGPPFGTTRDEVVARFAPEFELLQDWVPRSYPNRTGLERMFWWRRRS